MRTLVLLMSVAVIATGCTTTQKSAGVGAGIGAVAGAIIWHQSGNRDKGALIGAAIGGASGAVVGDKIKERKFCPSCGRTTDTDKEYCPFDGYRLKIKNK